MPFLDVPSSGRSSSSLLLDGNRLAAGRPQPEDDVLGPLISFPGRASSKLNTQVITPLASFVLKSVLAEPASVYVASENTSTTFEASQKIFINVCHHGAVPGPSSLPSTSPSPSALAKEHTLPDEGWIPGVVGDMAITLDRAGAPSLLVDVIVATTVHERSKDEPGYKRLVIQHVLEHVETKFSVELARDYSTPKTLKSKGPLVARSVVLPAPRATAPGVVVPLALSPSDDSTVLASATRSTSTSTISTSTDDDPALPRLRTTFELSELDGTSVGASTTTSSSSTTTATTTPTSKPQHAFTLRIHLPGDLRPSPSEPAPRTTLELLPPGRFSFAVEATCRATVDVLEQAGRLGAGWSVSACSVEAEWLVGQGVLVVGGLLVEGVCEKRSR